MTTNNNDNSMSVMDMIVMARLGVDETWFTDNGFPLEPYVFANDEEASRRAMAVWLNNARSPMSTYEMARRNPMSYYIQVEEDATHVPNTSDVTYMEELYYSQGDL